MATCTVLARLDHNLREFGKASITFASVGALKCLASLEKVILKHLATLAILEI
jgi:hypothetical protein